MLSQIHFFESSVAILAVFGKNAKIAILILKVFRFFFFAKLSLPEVVYIETFTIYLNWNFAFSNPFHFFAVLLRFSNGNYQAEDILH